MTGILLSAGFGTRLYPITKSHPKALLEVEGRAILDYLMDQFLEWPECDSLHLLSNAKMYGQYYVWAKEWSPRLKENVCSLHMYSNGTLEAGDSPGAVIDLHRIVSRLDKEGGAWITATDSIYRFDIHPLIERYKQSGHSQVMALLQPNAQRLRDQSVLDLIGDRVVGVVDQPEDPPSKWVCPSCYVLSEDALQFLNSHVEVAQETDSLGAFIHALAQEHPVEAWRQPEGDTPADFTASDLRFHINTRYQYKKAQSILENEPVRKQATVRN